MFLQIIYLWLSQHNVGIYPTYNENISLEASTSMNEPFRCVNMVFIDVCTQLVVVGTNEYLLLLELIYFSFRQ